MKEIDNYISWDHYALLYNSENHDFSIQCLKKQKALSKVRIESIIVDGKNIGGVEIFKQWKYASVRLGVSDHTALSVKFSKGPDVLPRLTLKFVIKNEGIRFSVNTPQNCVVNFVGDLSWGDGSNEHIFPMSLSKNNEVVRSAIGPASSNKDNMLFDKLSDNGLVVDGADKLRIKYDWKKKSYTFRATTGARPSEKVVHVYVKENILADLFHINYHALNRNRTFATPPMGWMTWYAVRFNACEEKVLKNAAWQAENLKKFGANVIWVDWEWCHKDFSGYRDDGCDFLHPDKEKYPNGLKYVADKIKEMGFVPALWISFTAESDYNEYMKKNPEIVLCDEKWWCGSYFFDLSHPKYLNEFLPLALNQVKEWGYEAVKFDTITQVKIFNEKHHSKIYNPSLTSKDLHRGLVKRVREILGEDMYMLSCAAESDGDLLWGVDYFESGRVGRDIFKWKEFIQNGIVQTLRFYPLHNNVFYADCDNLVLREEYNDYNQARSRVYFVSMLGMPMTFGDEFDALDDARIELLKKTLPVLDIHPMDVYRQTKLGDALKMNLIIEKEWESYNVVNVFNKSGAKKAFVIDFENDLDVDNGEYLVYDFTNDEFVGLNKDDFRIELDENESRVFGVRKKVDRPQLLSTSRHISQGAAEIHNMEWNNNTLTITADVVEDEAYTITIYVPSDYTAPSDFEKVCGNVYKKTILPKKSVAETIKIKFSK